MYFCATKLLLCGSWSLVALLYVMRWARGERVQTPNEWIQSKQERLCLGLHNYASRHIKRWTSFATAQERPQGRLDTLLWCTWVSDGGGRLAILLAMSAGRGTFRNNLRHIKTCICSQRSGFKTGTRPMVYDCKTNKTNNNIDMCGWNSCALSCCDLVRFEVSTYIMQVKEEVVLLRRTKPVDAWWWCSTDPQNN